MGSSAAEDAFSANHISMEEFKISAASILKNENLILRIQGKYLKWEKAAHVILGIAAFGFSLPIEPQDVIPVEKETPESKEDDSDMTSTPSRSWRLWPIPFRRVKTLEHTGSNSSKEEVFVDSGSVSQSQPEEPSSTVHSDTESPRKQIIRTNVPTIDQIASLNLKEGQNMVSFIFSTRVLGSQKVRNLFTWSIYVLRPVNYLEWEKAIPIFIHTFWNRLKLIYTCGSGIQELLFLTLMGQLPGKL